VRSERSEQRSFLNTLFPGHLCSEHTEHSLADVRNERTEHFVLYTSRTRNCWTLGPLNVRNKLNALSVEHLNVHSRSDLCSEPQEH
jgi:hypothetical protein